MAGAIASRERLLGVAPGAKILAVRAFGETSAVPPTCATVQHPQGHRLGGQPGRARHQHELRRVRSDPALEPRAQACRRTRRTSCWSRPSGNAGCREVAAALAGRRLRSVIAVTATDCGGHRGFQMANQRSTHVADRRRRASTSSSPAPRAPPTRWRPAPRSRPAHVSARSRP